MCLLLLVDHHIELLALIYFIAERQVRLFRILLVLLYDQLSYGLSKEGTTRLLLMLMWFCWQRLVD